MKPFVSEFLEMRKRHLEELNSLRKRCKHPKKDIKISFDGSQIGLGCRFPSVHVICKNCGRKKVMFRETDDKEMKVKIVKTLKRQAGIRDQRLGLVALYDYEVED